MINESKYIEQLERLVEELIDPKNENYMLLSSESQKLVTYILGRIHAKKNKIPVLLRSSGVLEITSHDRKARKN